MLIAIVGGNLQGVEAAYLARKAGFETLLVDKRPEPPASGLCDRFLQHQVCPENSPGGWLKGVDVILPAFEDAKALGLLMEWGKKADIPVAFDPAAYAVSSSKQWSDRLFARMGLAVPVPWPQCRFPVIVKPDGKSGSQGVCVLENRKALSAHMTTHGGGDAWVVQEFVPGPSFSLEVIGGSGGYTVFQVTDLFMDSVFDCKRVTAPTTLPEPAMREFQRLSLAIAEELNLTGIMDVEAIYSGNGLKVLEIDARLPSQTPTAVYWSSGVNQVEHLLKAVTGHGAPASVGCDGCRFVIYEHIKLGPGTIEVAGEHIMSRAGLLHVQKDFWGADEAVTNYEKGRDRWVATMIYSGASRESVLEKRRHTMDAIHNKFAIDH